MEQGLLGAVDGWKPLGRYEEAMRRAGRLLAFRPRTVVELRDRLVEAGFGEDVVDATMARLGELRLLDDFAFALQWIEERSTRKGLGPRALEAELQAKGVPRSTIQDALARSGFDEGAAARAAAEKQLKKVMRYPLREQGGRLIQALVRKGFSLEAAEEGARAMLPPEGWD